jgi:spermidine synthase
MRAAILLILLLAGLAGAGTMAVELAAVRLLAPCFGASLVVWTNVLASILVALALGYLLGGRLAAGERSVRRLGWVLLGAAVATAIAPMLARALIRGLAPGALALHEATDVVLWGSLATALVVFGPPALLLGSASPLAVDALAARGGFGAGRAGALVLCAGTLGSLAGVFATTHLLLPALGLAWTFRVAGLVLAAAGSAAFAMSRGGRHEPALAAAAALIGGLASAARAPVADVPEGSRLLAAGESPYQSVRVVEQGTGVERLRFLQVNESFDSFQSVWQPELGLLPEGYYYNDFALPFFWDEERSDWRVLVLGLGGGTALRVLAGVLPEGDHLDAVGIEIDPLVVAFARRYLDLDPSAFGARTRARVVAGIDARTALRALDAPFDLVLLDCYANQVELPAHLVTSEFFAELEGLLAEGGWIVANLGGFGFEDPIVAAVAHTCAIAFDLPVLVLAVPRARNFILVARRGELPLDAEGLPRSAGGSLAARAAKARLVQGFRVFDPADDGLTLTDDRSPSERLQARSLREARGRLLGAAQVDTR